MPQRLLLRPEDLEWRAVNFCLGNDYDHRLLL